MSQTNVLESDGLRRPLVGLVAFRQTSKAVVLWDKEEPAQPLISYAAPDAESLARRAVERNPNDVESWSNLGALLAGKGELAESLSCFEAAVRCNPNSASALNNLGVALQHVGRSREAEVFYRNALRIAPEFVEVQMNLGTLLAALGRIEEGLQVAAGILTRDPRMVRAQLLVATLESGAGRHEAALSWLELAARNVPDNLDVAVQRAEALSKTGRYEEALNECRRVLQGRGPDSRALHIGALALKGLNRLPEALDAFRAAEAASTAPLAPIISDRAWTLAEMGRTTEAIELFDHALRLQPDLNSALCHRAYLKRRLDESEIAALDRIADDPDRSEIERMNLCFALGQAHLNSGDGDRAFKRLGLANCMKRGQIQYDPLAEERRAEEIIGLFSEQNLDRLAGLGDPTSDPIFVFGMPRSGTTLVEQILASHPQVTGLGEPTHLWDLVNESRLLERFPLVGAQDLTELGNRYLGRIRREAPGAIRVVDKMTWNFLYAGLISLILPNARMIHCRRDPLDTCLSCYSMLFTSGHPYAYDLTELGRFHRLYQKVMANWERVLDPRRLLQVDYESLVGDPETEIGRLLEFCDLPWEDSCLKFHETDRRVTSASLDQVRSPIYRSSVSRAQRFRPWLAPLEAALAEVEPAPCETGPELTT